MENILMVIEERDKAVCELERGEWIGPKEEDAIDRLGRPVRRLTEEHIDPPPIRDENESMFGDWTTKLLRLEREKRIRARREEDRMKRFENERERRKRVYQINEDQVFKSTNRS